MHKNGHHFAGKLKLTYTLGVVREQECINRPYAVDRSHLVEDILPPFDVYIRRVMVTGMPRVHEIGPNEPRVRISHDDWSKTSPVSLGSSEEAQWTMEDLAKNNNGETWKVPVMDDDKSVIFSIVSGSELVGLCEMKVLDLLAIPRDSQGVADIIVALMKGTKTQGRLRVTAQFLNSSTKYTPDVDEEAEAAGAEAEAEAARKAQERQKFWQEKQKLADPNKVEQERMKFKYALEDYKEKKAREEKEAAEQAGRDALNRLQLQQEMELARDREMAVQHRALLNPSLTHKYAPMGDNPSGLVGGTGTLRLLLSLLRVDWSDDVKRDATEH